MSVWNCPKNTGHKHIIVERKFVFGKIKLTNKTVLETGGIGFIGANLIGFYNILEACRHSYDDGAKGVEHLVYASSSSVYGSNKKVPYSTEDKVDNPVSLYAATKKKQRTDGPRLQQAL